MFEILFEFIYFPIFKGLTTFFSHVLKTGTHTHTHTHTYIHTCMHAYITYTYVRTYTHVYIYIHIHTDTHSGPDNVVGIETRQGQTVRGSNPGDGETFHTCPYQHWGRPASYTIGTGSLSRGKSGQGVALTNPPHLTPKLKKGYSYTYSPPVSPSWHIIRWNVYTHTHTRARARIFVYAKLTLLRAFLVYYPWPNREHQGDMNFTTCRCHYVEQPRSLKRCVSNVAVFGREHNSSSLFLITWENFNFFNSTLLFQSFSSIYCDTKKETTSGRGPVVGLVS
jgi:hypothetical protein